MATAQQPLSSEVHHLTRKPLELEAVAVSITPLDLLRQAIAQGVSVEQLERLQDLYQGWDANQARKAYCVQGGRAHHLQKQARQDRAQRLFEARRGIRSRHTGSGLRPGHRRIGKTRSLARTGKPSRTAKESRSPASSPTSAVTRKNGR